ncbi:endonuclease/exonuclease/phosphatase family protein [Joostella sp. CR20]|uniref:endonuclease/exonuclease/phosphatase family protein n=1 Tax=Joostella sp. CR20 TaxID=2804312 RepID=UPI00313CB39B
MKNLIITALFTCLSLHSFQVRAQEVSVKVMTTNIRYASPNDGINIWDNRKDWLCEHINFEEVDVLGGQEVIYTQLQDMIKRLPSYNYVGIGRNGGTEGEFCPIFFKKDKYDLLASDTFWLSETPSVENSKGWDAALPRIVTWVKLKEKESGKEFFFFNTHFDHKGAQARLNSAQLLIEKTKAIAGANPFFVTGDFNFPPSVEAYKILSEENKINFILKDTYKDANKLYGPNYTFNGFNLEPDENRERIDYIFYQGDITIQKHHIIDGQRGAKFISDHFPIIVDAVIK